MISKYLKKIYNTKYLKGKYSVASDWLGKMSESFCFILLVDFHVHVDQVLKISLKTSLKRSVLEERRCRLV